MKNLKSYIFVLLALIAFTASAAKTVSAASILDGLRTKIIGAPSVESVFTINGGEGPVQGSVILSGSKYTMTTPQMRAWFDGRTQWTLLQSSREVNVSEPDRAELMSSNPFAILTAHKDYYTARRLKDAGGMQRVELVPRDRTSAISDIVVAVNPRTGWPTSLEVSFDDNRKISVRIDRMNAGNAKAPSAFAFNAKDFPGYEIVDLR